MNYNNGKNKVKSQKIAAILLIVVPTLVLASYFKENDFAIKNTNGYVMVCSLIVLIICGLIGLRNSLRKEREGTN